MIRLSLATIVLCAVVGCGEDYGQPVEVTGKVTKGDKIVSQARVEFHAVSSKLPAEFRTHIATTDEQGVYKLEKVFPAEYEVRVEKFEGGSVDPGDAPASGGMDATNEDGEIASPWKREVSSDKTVFDFDLDKPATGK